MGTSLENTLTNFDLDLLLGPPPTSLSEIQDNDYLAQNEGINGTTHHGFQTQITETADHGYHVQTHETTNQENKTQNMGNITPTERNFHDQNMGKLRNTDYDYQVQNMGNESIYNSQVNNEVVSKSEYEALESHCKKLSADYLSLQSSYETVSTDYVAVKKQYAKLASDYANLHKENKEHAMESLNISGKCENFERKEVDYLATINTLNKEYQRSCLELSAQNKQFLQFQSHIEDLMAEIVNLKNSIKSEKNLGKDSRKMISTLTNNNQSLTEHLCLFACVIEGRRQLDKDCRRLIKKYCKKTTLSCKKSIIDSEIMENQSIDTGRGSSLAFSDGERSSFNSPAYSSPCSPFSIGISTPRNDYTKVTRDSFTSPPPIIKTIDISTSPIAFEVVATSIPAIKTSEAATNTVNYDESKTPVPKTKTVHIATSPVKFTNMWIPITKTKTIDTATSPIGFAETRTSVAKFKTIGAAVSPMFPDTRSPVVNKTMLDTAVSPIMFADTRIPVAKTRTLDTATSPIAFADVSSLLTKTKTIEIATSSVELNDPNTKTWDIADSPIMLADTRTPIVKTKIPVDYADTGNAPVMISTKSSKPKDIDSSINYNSVKPPLATTKSEELSGDIKYINPRVIISSPSMLDTECANVLKTKTLQVVNMTNTKFLKPIAFIPSTRHTENFREKLNEVVSKQSNQSQVDLENDLEIKTILSKLRLDWGMLSPMSLTPEPEPNQSENKAENKQSHSTSEKEVSDKSYTLVQSLYLSSDENSEDEIDREDCHITDLPCENSEHVKTRRENFNADEQNTSTSVIESIVLEPDYNKDISNKGHVKSNKTTSKYQKVTTLQKNYKANTPKSKVKSPQKRILKPLKKQRCKLFTITPIKPSAILSQNKERASQLAERLQDNKDDARVVEVCKESVKACNKEAHQNSKQTQLNGPHLSTNALNSSGPIESLCNSTESLSNNTLFATPHPPTSAEFDAKIICTLKQTQRTRNISHSPTNMFVKSNTNRRVCIPSNTKYEIPTAQSNRLPQSSPSLEVPTDFDIETNYTYPKPTIKRLSRVKNGISAISSNIPTKHTESNQTNENINNHSDTTSSNVFNVKTDSKGIPQTNTAKEQTSKEANEITNDDDHNNKNDSGGSQHSGTSHTRNNNTLLKKSLNCETRPCADYRDINMFDDQNVCGITENNETTKESARECITNQDDIDTTILPKSPNRQTKKYADNSDTNMLDAQNKEASEITKQSAREGILDRYNNNIDSTILAQSTNHETRHYTDYSDTSIFDDQNVCENKEVNEITKQSARESILNQDNNNIDSTILAKTSNSRKRRRANDSDNLNVIGCEPENYDKNGIPESWNQNILDRMIYMYGSMGAGHRIPKYGDEVVTKIKKGIKKCVNSMQKPDDYPASLQQLVDELKPHGKEQIGFGLMKYLNDPARKSEFVATNRHRNGYYVGPSASPTEMALIDVIELLDQSVINIRDLVLDISEFILFTLERESTPCFDVVESVSHFFANFCKYRGDMSRLWMFMLNAMYCLSFKAVLVIKNCLDIVPRLIPYAGAYIVPAQAPLIRCFVFLLNFYACDDRLKRVDEIRRRLKYDYHYNLQDENETTLLFMLKTSIIHLADQRLDKEMLELSFLIVAKRRGTKWCHKNIVQKILLPMIKGEIEASYTAKRFCIITIGCIMKPYNNDMTVHTEEVVNLLIKMFKEESQSNEIKEDIIRSLISMNIKTLWHRINACLSTWTPPSSASPEFHQALQIYVQGKSLKIWRAWHQYYVEET